jgi:hypothetical protein
MQNPQSLNADEIKELAASVLTQAGDHPKAQQFQQGQQNQSQPSQQSQGQQKK